MDNMQLEKARVVVGFDLRSLMSPAIASASATSMLFSQIADHSQWRPATLDMTIWSKSSHVCPKVKTNNFDLYWLPDFWGAECKAVNAATLAAFDLPVLFLNHIGKEDHVTKHSLNALLVDSRWEFCGFDVIDRLVSYSALWSIRWPDADVRPMREFCEKRLNCFGLLTSYDDALTVSDWFTAFPAGEFHSPFAPCGVWIKRFS